MRERRIMLRLTQQQLADLMGVTYQQTHKYEVETNRMAAGRLYKVAQVLGVDISYFFEELEGGAFRATPQQRLLSELSKNFTAVSREHQRAICSLVRTLAEPSQSTTEKA